MQTSAQEDNGTNRKKIHNFAISTNPCFLNATFANIIGLNKNITNQENKPGIYLAYI